MKYQGKIFNWDDDKGFGFVEANGDGERAFVHIKSFKSGSRRPVNGELITYSLVREKDNRYKAKNIQFVLNKKNITKNNHKRSTKRNIDSKGFFNILIIIFSLTLLISVLLKKLPIIIIGAYIAMNIVTFIAYAIDKSAAQNNRWRTKENTLHLFSLLGGWPGAFYAQTQLHHKSSKQSFKNVYYLTIVINLAGLFWLYTSNGSHFLNQLTSSLFSF